MRSMLGNSKVKNITDLIKKYEAFNFLDENVIPKNNVFFEIVDKLDQQLEQEKTIEPAVNKFLVAHQDEFFYWACLYKKINLFQYFADKCPGKLQVNQEFILKLADEKNLAFIHSFYKSGANINLQHYRHNFETIGSKAAKEKNYHLLAYLLITNFNFGLEDEEGKRLLDIAAHNKDILAQIIIYIGLIKNFIESSIRQIFGIEDKSLRQNVIKDNNDDFAITNPKIENKSKFLLIN
jgi:hypothetical protein